MNSPSALAEHVSLNLARFSLLDLVKCLGSRSNEMAADPPLNYQAKEIFWQDGLLFQIYFIQQSAMQLDTARLACPEFMCMASLKEATRGVL